MHPRPNGVALPLAIVPCSINSALSMLHTFGPFYAAYFWPILCCILLAHSMLHTLSPFYAAYFWPILCCILLAHSMLHKSQFLQYRHDFLRADIDAAFSDIIMLKKPFFTEFSVPTRNWNENSIMFTTALNTIHLLCNIYRRSCEKSSFYRYFRAHKGQERKLDRVFVTALMIFSRDITLMLHTFGPFYAAYFWPILCCILLAHSMLHTFGPFYAAYFWPILCCILLALSMLHTFGPFYAAYFWPFLCCILLALSMLHTFGPFYAAYFKPILCSMEKTRAKTVAGLDKNRKSAF
jgi:hypothetical protein